MLILYVCDIVVVQTLSLVWLFATPRNAAHQAPLSFIISQSLLKFMSIGLVMPSNHLILCHPFLLFLQSFPASGSFPMSRLFAWGSQSIGTSASVLPMNIQLISFRIDWFDLLAVSESLLQHHNLKASVLRCSAFLMVQLTSVHDYWKYHSFDCVDLCWQSDVTAF